jgi:hypothetical protein
MIRTRLTMETNIASVGQRLHSDKRLVSTFPEKWTPSVCGAASDWEERTIRRCGGEGGIRTRVGVISPQTAFEAAPLRPLRYLSGRGSIERRAFYFSRFAVATERIASAMLPIPASECLKPP